MLRTVVVLIYFRDYEFTYFIILFNMEIGSLFEVQKGGPSVRRIVGEQKTS